jgi:hypothetical protein
MTLNQTPSLVLRVGTNLYKKPRKKDAHIRACYFQENRFLVGSLETKLNTSSTKYITFFLEAGVGQNQAWMPTYASILRIPQMI